MTHKLVSLLVTLLRSTRSCHQLLSVTRLNTVHPPSHWVPAAMQRSLDAPMHADDPRSAFACGDGSAVPAVLPATERSPTTGCQVHADSRVASVLADGCGGAVCWHLVATQEGEGFRAGTA